MTQNTSHEDNCSCIDPATKTAVFDGPHLIATFEYDEDAAAYAAMAAGALGASYRLAAAAAEEPAAAAAAEDRSNAATYWETQLGQLATVGQDDAVKLKFQTMHTDTKWLSLSPVQYEKLEAFMLSIEND